ncbi:hypothetical protein [Sorangium sp. So ce204]|uniref:hypothetical protein n=1 Tax=Sorangium sp. So ce204 TaxID=3133288 RepID=UPI003F604FF3
MASRCAPLAESRPCPTFPERSLAIKARSADDGSVEPPARMLLCAAPCKVLAAFLADR